MAKVPTLEHKTDVLEAHILPKLDAHDVQRIDRNVLETWLVEVSRKRKPNGVRYAEESVLVCWRRLKALGRGHAT